MFKRALLALLDWCCRKEFIERSRIDGFDGTLYLTRYVIRKGDRRNIFIHHFHRSDADDFHDHPWDFTTFILAGGYFEVTPWGKARRTLWHGPLSRIRHRAEDRHQVLLKGGEATFDPHGVIVASTPIIEAWSLVFTGPKRRDWGFWTTHGFVPWKKYMDMKFGRDNWTPA